MSARGLRDIITDLSPHWKATGIYEKIDYACTLVADALLEKAYEGILARIPTRTLTSDSLPYIGADRLIQQGLVETVAGYAARLKRAYDDWPVAGTPRAVIAQVRGYLSPTSPTILAVTSRAIWDYVTAPSALTTIPTHLYSGALNWDWDSLSHPSIQWRWWRTFLLIDATGWATNEGTWGDGDLWGDASKSWGMSVPATVVTSVRNSVIALWKSANTSVEWIIVMLAGIPDPTAAPGAANLADGYYGYWGKLGTDGSGRPTRVPARNANHRYCNGIA